MLNKAFYKKASKNFLIIASIIVFVTVFGMLFGANNQLIGVGLITGILMFKDVGIGIKRNQSAVFVLLLCIVLGLCNILSFYNIYLSFFVNFIAILSLMFLFSARLDYKSYIPFILMYIFAQSTKIPVGAEHTRFFAFLASGVILAFTLKFVCKEDIDTDVKCLTNNLLPLNINSIFIIKMTIGVSLAMFLGDFLGLHRTMWISITVMSLTQLDTKEMKDRLRFRIIGTLIGFVIFLIIFNSVLSEHIVIITLAMSYIYTFIEGYMMKMIFITINSLNAAQGIYGEMLNSSMSYRISHILVGIIIVLSIFYIDKFLNRKAATS